MIISVKSTRPRETPYQHRLSSWRIQQDVCWLPMLHAPPHQRRTKELHIIYTLSFHRSHATSLQTLEKFNSIGRLRAFVLSCFRSIEGRREPAGARCRSHKHEDVLAVALHIMFITEVLGHMMFTASPAWEKNPSMKNQ